MEEKIPWNIRQHLCIQCQMKSVCVHIHTRVCTHIHMHIHTCAKRHKTARGNAYSDDSSSLGDIFPFALSATCRCSRAAWGLLDLNPNPVPPPAKWSLCWHCFQLVTVPRAVPWEGSRDKPGTRNLLAAPVGCCPCVRLAEGVVTVPVMLPLCLRHPRRGSLHSPQPRPHPVALNEKTWL